RCGGGGLRDRKGLAREGGLVHLQERRLQDPQVGRDDLARLSTTTSPRTSRSALTVTVSPDRRTRTRVSSAGTRLCRAAAVRRVCSAEKRALPPTTPPTRPASTGEPVAADSPDATARIGVSGLTSSSTMAAGRLS